MKEADRYNDLKIRSIHALLFFLCLFFRAYPAAGEEFFYKHREGDRYRILSTVTEDVYIERKFSHSAEIINRIAVELIAINEDTGSFRAVFQTAEKATVAGKTENFEWSREYISEFDRNRLGYLVINSKYFMPVVRNVPVFPERDLEPGDTWSAEGYEVHDFRDSFGIPDPYRIPFMAEYLFLGEREWKGNSYPAFSVSYHLLNEPPPPETGRIWPRRIQGASDQIIYWDLDIGQTVAYEESFRLIFELSNGVVAEYQGRADAEMIEAPAMDKEMIAEEVLENIQRMDIQGTSVRVEETGVTISIENIQFMADSSSLIHDEILKLDKIIEILNLYPERDILVSGHTALAGTKEMRDALSLERARIVADYLLEKKVRTPDRIVIQGFGAEKPLADNNTEANRARNRRVEITILEN